MKPGIIVIACIGLIAVAMPRDALAGVWRWGCKGPAGENEIIFTRYNLAVVPPKPSRGTLRHLIFLDDLGKDEPDVSPYVAEDENSGFTPKMEFSRGDDGKDRITLTEKSSKSVSHRSAMVCGRDESTDVYRKVYRYQHNAEPARDVTLQCMEYQLTTRGGRPCINRP